MERIQFLIGNAGLCHEASVSGINGFSIQHAFHTKACRFMKIFYIRQWEILCMGSFNNGFSNGVGGVDFTGSGQGKNVFFLIFPIGNDGADFEFSFCNGACFIHDSCFDFGNHFHHCAALKENAIFGSPSYACKESQRNGNDKGAGAGNNQESEGSINPFFPVSAKEKGRNHSCQQGGCYDGGRINSGKTGNEAVNLRLTGHCIFHGIQNTADHGFGKNFHDLDFNGAGHIHAARVYMAAFFGSYWFRLAGNSRCIDFRTSFHNQSVQGDTVAGADQKDIAHSGIFRRKCFHLIPGYAVNHLGTKVYSRHNLAAASVAGQVLQIFTDAVEEHDAHSFRIFLYAEGSQGGNGHEESFIEEFPMGHIFQGCPYNGAAQNKVGNKEQHVSVQFRHSQSLDRMIVEQHAQNEEKAANPKLSFFCEYFFVKRNILCLWRN